MIQRLHRLKNKRGYTVLELVIVVAIIAIMSATIVAGSTTRQSRIREATSTAKDFYTTIQTEFTRFQMFDGPLTMSLQKQYNASPNSAVTSRRYGGMMWFPKVGGNYPISPDASKMASLYVNSDASEWRTKGVPPVAGLTVEVHVINNKILSVDWDYTTASLFAKGIDEESDLERSELSAVLQLELDRRMEYKDGYYYARVVYVSPGEAAVLGSGGDPSYAKCKATPVYVLWAAYCREQMTSDASTYTFRTNYVTNSGQIVGIVGGDVLGAEGGSEILGAPGTNVLDVFDPTSIA